MYCTKIGTYEWICWNIGSSDHWTSFLNFFLLKEKGPRLTGQTITLRIVSSSGPSVMLSIKSPARFLDFRFRAGPTQGSSRPDPTRRQALWVFCSPRAAEAQVSRQWHSKRKDFMGQTEIKTSSSSTLTQPNITPWTPKHNNINNNNNTVIHSLYHSLGTKISPFLLILIAQDNIINVPKL